MARHNITFAHADGAYKCWSNLHRTYKDHADALYNQTGQSGASEYWEAFANNPKVKNPKKQQLIFEKIDGIIGGDKEVAAEYVVEAN